MREEIRLFKVNLRNDLADKEINTKREILKRMKVINKLKSCLKR